MQSRKTEQVQYTVLPKVIINIKPMGERLQFGCEVEIVFIPVIKYYSILFI